MGPLALLGSAFYPILVHRLADYAPRFLPTLSHPHAVALHFVRRDQLTAGLAPARTGSTLSADLEVQRIGLGVQSNTDRLLVRRRPPQLTRAG